MAPAASRARAAGSPARAPCRPFVAATAGARRGAVQGGGGAKAVRRWGGVRPVRRLAARQAPGRAERAGSPARAPPRPAVGARAAPPPSGVYEPEKRHAVGGWTKELVRALDTAGPPSDEGGGVVWHQRAADDLVQCVVGDGFHRHVHLRPGAGVRLRRAPAGQRRHPFSPSPYGESLLQNSLRSTPPPPRPPGAGGAARWQTGWRRRSAALRRAAAPGPVRTLQSGRGVSG